MNIFKKTILTVLASLFIIGNVSAEKIKIGTEGAYPLHGIQKMLQEILLVLRSSLLKNFVQL